jgi:hypothetical protein
MRPSARWLVSKTLHRQPPVTGFNTTGVAKINTTIQTPTSGSTAIIIRPSAVTRLLTNTKTTITTLASAEASVTVSVKLDGNPTPKLPSVVYDQRLRLSAHSHDFVVPNPNANGTNYHNVEVDFSLSTQWEQSANKHREAERFQLRAVHGSRPWRTGLVQFSIFCPGLFQHRDTDICVSPQFQEIKVRRTRSDPIALE